MIKFFSKSQTSVRSIAAVMFGVSVLGVVIAIVRDRIFAYHLGASELLDVYVASFKIPDLLFLAVTSLISVYGILPMFEKRKQEGEVQLQQFINTAFYFLSFFLLVGGTIVFFALPFLTEIFFSSLESEHLRLVLLFSRIFIIQVILLAISNFFTSILQLKRKFVMFAVLPIFYNIGIIIGALVLFPKYGISGVIAGVLIGAALHLGIQIPLIISQRALPRLSPMRCSMKDCWGAVRTSVPRSLTMITLRVVEIVLIGFLIAVSSGAAGIYYLADNIRAVPIVVIGMAYATATYPILVEQYVGGNMSEFIKTIEYGLRKLFFLLIPVVCLLFLFSEEIIRVLFETGSFTTADTQTASLVLSLLAFGAITISIISILSRALYALNKTYIPLLIIGPFALLEIAIIYALRHYGIGSATLIKLDTMIPLFTSTELLLIGSVGTIVVFEIIVASILLIVVYRTMRHPLKSILSNLKENVLTSFCALAAALFVKIVFFGTPINVFEKTGLLEVGVVVVIWLLVWYGLLRWYDSEDIDLSVMHLRNILKGLWIK